VLGGDVDLAQDVHAAGADHEVHDVGPGANDQRELGQDVVAQCPEAAQPDAETLNMSRLADHDPTPARLMPTSHRIISLLCLSALIAPRIRAAEPSPADLQFFAHNIRPLLAEHCYKCHSQKSEKLKGHLLLDSPEGWLKGGDTGPAIVPGATDKSLLIEAVRYTNPDLEMPPKGKLPDAAIALLTTQLGARAINRR